MRACVRVRTGVYERGTARAMMYTPERARRGEGPYAHDVQLSHYRVSFSCDYFKSRSSAGPLSPAATVAFTADTAEPLSLAAALPSYARNGGSVALLRTSMPSLLP